MVLFFKKYLPIVIFLILIIIIILFYKKALPQSYVFVTKWGIEGIEEGEFNRLSGIAVDSQGYVYVTDNYNHCVQKFDSDGNFIVKWGSKGSNSGQLDCPEGITTDLENYVYVADSHNNRIVKFSSNGDFVTTWGNEVSSDEVRIPKNCLRDIENVIDINKLDFLVDKKVSTDKIESMWEEGYFSDDEIGVIYDYGHVGELHLTGGVTTDASGNIFVTDGNNILKFTSDGYFLESWITDNRLIVFDQMNISSTSSRAIAIDVMGNIYSEMYVDQNKCIKKSTSSGESITTWKSIDSPVGIATDLNGNVFIANYNENCIWKLDMEGNIITKWGSKGISDGQFNNPVDIAVDAEGYVYVADRGNHRIQKFNPNP